MSTGASDILSRDDIQRLIERNNLNPDSGRPIYEAWTDNKATATPADLPATCKSVCMHTWTKRLHSKHWRTQPKGKNRAELVTRPVKKGGQWTHVPLNSRTA